MQFGVRFPLKVEFVARTVASLSIPPEVKPLPAAVAVLPEIVERRRVVVVPYLAAIPPPFIPVFPAIVLSVMFTVRPKVAVPLSMPPPRPHPESSVTEFPLISLRLIAIGSDALLKIPPPRH